MKNYPNKRSTALTLLIVVCGLEYGIILFFGIIAPILHRYGKDGDEFFTLYRESLTASLIIIVGAFVSALLMRRSLQFIRDQMKVRVWSMAAMLVAPISATFHSAMIPYLPSVTGNIYFIIKLGAFTIGLFMPFVLLTLWLRYKYRQDEF